MRLSFLATNCLCGSINNTAKLLIKTKTAALENESAVKKQSNKMKNLLPAVLLLACFGTQTSNAYEESVVKRTLSKTEDHACDLPAPRHAYTPLEWNQNTICFIYEQLPPDLEAPYLRPADEIALYTKSISGTTSRIREFSKVSTKGITYDAFVTSATDGKNRVEKCG